MKIYIVDCSPILPVATALLAHVLLQKLLLRLQSNSILFLTDSCLVVRVLLSHFKVDFQIHIPKKQVRKFFHHRTEIKIHRCFVCSQQLISLPSSLSTTLFSGKQKKGLAGLPSPSQSSDSIHLAKVLLLAPTAQSITLAREVTARMPEINVSGKCNVAS